MGFRVSVFHPKPSDLHKTLQPGPEPPGPLRWPDKDFAFSRAFVGGIKVKNLGAIGL